MVVPGDLAVIVGVDVDKAGGDDLPAGVDLIRARAGDVAHSGDLPVLHRDIGPEARRAGAIDHGPAADHQVVGAFLSGHDISSVAVPAA